MRVAAGAAALTALFLSFTAPASGIGGWHMALSWSPEYCKKNGQAELQCAEEHYFVNHGLAIAWNKDEGPSSDCQDWRMLTTDTDRWLWVIPNREQIRRLWEKQGACSGLDRETYFAQVERAGRRIEIPDEFSGVSRQMKLTPGDVRRAFAAANPGMSEGGVVLHCNAEYLREIEICFDADMQFQRCEAADDCPQEVRLRPIRLDRQDRKPPGW